MYTVSITHNIHWLIIGSFRKFNFFALKKPNFWRFATRTYHPDSSYFCSRFRDSITRLSQVKTAAETSRHRRGETWMTVYDETENIGTASDDKWTWIPSVAGAIIHEDQREQCAIFEPQISIHFKAAKSQSALRRYCTYRDASFTKNKFFLVGVNLRNFIGDEY